MAISGGGPSRTELHNLCCAEPLHTNEHFDAILRRTREHPEEAKIEDNESGSLALHLLLRSDPPLHVVMALVEAYPEALFEENKHGYLPLHVACRYGNSKEVVEYLIQQNPQAKTRSTQSGSAPLELFSWNNLWNNPYEMAHYLMSGGKGLSCHDLIKKLPDDHPHRSLLLDLFDDEGDESS